MKSHPCGTDITSVIPPSHVGNPAKYLLPNNVGDICTAVVQPTATPVPKPTNTPVPTIKPTSVPTATSAPKPTNTPVPTKPAQQTALPTATPIVLPTKPISVVTLPPTAIPRPTLIVRIPTATNISKPGVVTIFPTTKIVIPTSVGNPLTSSTPVNNTPVPALSYAPTPLVTHLVQPIGPAISFSFAFPGIGPISANLRPIHATKNITLLVYPVTGKIQDPTTQPLYSVPVQAAFDADPNSSTYASYIVRQKDLGATVPAGDYQLAFKTDQTIITPITDVSTNTFHLSPGVTVTDSVPVKNVVVGDLTGDSVIDIKDYNAFVDCYGIKAQESVCTVANAADFNDDSFVDGIDYILFLESIRSIMLQGKPAPTLAIQLPVQQIISPTLPVASTPVPTSAFRYTPVPRKTVVPTMVITVEPTRKASPKHIIPTPTPIPPKANLMKSLFAASTGIFLSKIMTILAFILLIGIAILGAYRSRLINALLHKNETKSETPAASAPPVSSPAVPPGVNPETKIYYVSKNSDEVVNNMHVVTLTDSAGSQVGYTAQLPSQDGYFSVNGYTQETDGTPSFMILSMTPSAKPPKTS